MHGLMGTIHVKKHTVPQISSVSDFISKLHGAGRGHTPIVGRGDQWETNDKEVEQRGH